MNKRILIITGLLISFILPLRTALSGEESNADYEDCVSVAVKLLKTVYEPNEPVPLIIAIANHSNEPVYLFGSEENYTEGWCTVRDANSLRRIMTDPIREPLPSSLDHYVEKNGKKTYVDPVYKIDGKAIMIAIMKDALKIYHNHIYEGIFQIEKDYITVIHQADIIIREDTPQRLWIEPSSDMVKVRHKAVPETLKIEIKKSKIP